MSDPRDLATETDALDAALLEDARAAKLSYLLVREGGAARLFELSGKDVVVIGRGSDADVLLDDVKASRRHAEVRIAEGAMRIVDLGSRNGTRLNGETLSGVERPLSGGDVMRIGEAELIVAVSSTRADRAPPPPGRADSDLLDGIIVADPVMAKVFTIARRLSRVNTNVLVVGETGAGKEVVAQQIHAWSPRSSGPFVRLNCASLPDALLESELFGYERGAFSGAEKRKLGYFEAAEKGTLFLDETGELSPAMQAKLLSVIENRSLHRLGGTQEIPIDVRFLCATHRDLEADVAAGKFREDLFYRISTFQLKIPPLRERPAEIALLAQLFVRELGRKMGIESPRIDPAASRALESHRWPGNVRELRNAIEHAIVLAEEGVVLPSHLPSSVGAATAAPVKNVMKQELEDVERRRIEEALTAEGGNQTRAAQRLGISRRTLVSRLTKYRTLDEK